MRLKISRVFQAGAPQRLNGGCCVATLEGLYAFIPFSCRICGRENPRSSLCNSSVVCSQPACQDLVRKVEEAWAAGCLITAASRGSVVLYGTAGASSGYMLGRRICG